MNEELKFKKDKNGNFSFIIDGYEIKGNSEKDIYSITFKNSAGYIVTSEINKDIAFAFIESKRQRSRENYFDREYSNEFISTSISKSLDDVIQDIFVEESFIKKEENKNINEAMDSLSEIQRKRIEKHIINEVPVTEMALVEKTNRQRIYKSIRLGIKKIRKLFKKN